MAYVMMNPTLQNVIGMGEIVVATTLTWENVLSLLDGMTITVTNIGDSFVKERAQVSKLELEYFMSVIIFLIAHSQFFL